MSEYRYTVRHGDPPTPAYQAADPPLPYPTGWFCLGPSTLWKPGSVQTQRFMGRDIVVHRTRSGILQAQEAHCPHLGAHLGAGGHVDGELLVCPFHQFAFDTEGTCVRTPYGTPPKTGLELLPSQERFGIVWVWHHPDEPTPTWDLPQTQGIDAGPLYRSTDLTGNPQEFVENAFDYQHFLYMHRVTVEEMAPPEFSDTSARVQLAISGIQYIRHLPLLRDTRMELTMTLIGLGAIYATVDLPQYGVHAVQWATATPIAPWRIRFWIITRADFTGTTALPPLLSNTLARPATALLTRAIHEFGCSVSSQDLPIWNHKKFIPHPKLNNQDGPVGPYRHWIRRFYP
ncbi:Rieske 2Fe-2S domain-containing protein [Streptomyces sp. NPDC056835]|uniref:Rieske 2Fe-2S domain-containing protein n=1 Tax=Streptomyces sp. NPDC056835 TaxID=3345956 RepID=UPI0036AAE252